MVSRLLHGAMDLLDDGARQALLQDEIATRVHLLMRQMERDMKCCMATNEMAIHVQRTVEGFMKCKDS